LRAAPCPSLDVSIREAHMVRAVDLSAAMGRTIDPMRLMQRVTDRTLELIGAADGVMVGLSDDHHVSYICGAGHRMSHLGTRVELDSSLSGLAVRTGELQRSDDCDADPRVDSAACRRLSVASLVCVPLSRTHETLGVLAVNARQAHAFDDDDVALLTQLADFMGVVIGSACDLSRVNAQLLDPGDPDDPDDLDDAQPKGSVSAVRRSADIARRYIMSVLSPDTVTQVESGQRIQAILDDPEVVSMVFQPIVDLVSDEVIAVEALARFDMTPYRPPDVWFAEAHQNELGVELELVAVTRAMSQLSILPDGVALTVNAGPDVVMGPEFRDAVLGGHPERLIIELTEHTAIEDYPALVAALRVLRRAGARIAIDDTGSGYSSLGHILKLAPDYIKLDRDLVNGIDVDPIRRALAASLVSFAAETGAQIIAEGVETAAELDVLRRLGVRHAQGYHLGYPGPLGAITDRHWQPATLQA
jgi:EAL domain-containing protein (putative c-di-GMP-specific phosphodiesterase class I)